MKAIAWWTAIMLHATCGIVAFAIGIAALRRDTVRRRRWLPQAVQWMVVGLVVFMTGAIMSHWDALVTTERITYCGLGGLGLYMLWRSRRAVRSAAQWLDDCRSSYIDDVGFVLIALFNGFVIVAAIDLGAPGWLVAALAIAAVIAGHTLVERFKATSSPAHPTAGDLPDTHHETARDSIHRTATPRRSAPSFDSAAHDAVYPHTSGPDSEA